jgi:hypothetical protein
MHRAGIGRRLDQGPERNSRCGATRGSSERVIERADLAQILVSHEEQRSDAPQYVCAGAAAKVAYTHRGLEFARMETETFRKTREVGASRIFRILIVVCAAFVLGRVAWLMRQPTPIPVQRSVGRRIRGTGEVGQENVWRAGTHRRLQARRQLLSNQTMQRPSAI